MCVACVPFGHQCFINDIVLFENGQHHLTADDQEDDPSMLCIAQATRNRSQKGAAQTHTSQISPSSARGIFLVRNVGLDKYKSSLDYIKTAPRLKPLSIGPLGNVPIDVRNLALLDSVQHHALEADTHDS